MISNLLRLGVHRFSVAKQPLIKRIVPEKYHPYVDLGRYDKTIGYMLLFWPCAWGLSLAVPMPCR